MASVLTNVGEDWVAQRLIGAGALSTFDMHFLAWGTGAGTAAKGDTTLFTEAAEARVSATMSVTGSGSTAKYQAVGTSASASGQGHQRGPVLGLHLRLDGREVEQHRSASADRWRGH